MQTLLRAIGPLTLALSLASGCTAETQSDDVETSVEATSDACEEAAAQIHRDVLSDETLVFLEYSGCGGIFRGLNPREASVSALRAEIRWAGLAPTNELDCIRSIVMGELYLCDDTTDTCRDAQLGRPIGNGEWDGTSCQVPTAQLDTLPPSPGGVKIFASAAQLLGGEFGLPVTLTLRAD